MIDWLIVLFFYPFFSLFGTGFPSVDFQGKTFEETIMPVLVETHLHYSFLYIINTWALIYKHCFKKWYWKALGGVYMHIANSKILTNVYIGVHAFEMTPDT